MTEPTVLFTHTVGPERGPDLRDRLVERGVSPEATRVATTPEETAEAIETADGIVTGRLDEETLERAASLRWVQALSAGVDSYPQETLRDRSVALTTSSGIHAEPIGEQVLGYLLAFERRFPTLFDQQAASHWERREGTELRGKTVGVIGVGAIGTRVAELVSAVGCRTLGTKRDLSDVPEAIDEIHPADDYRTVAEASDYLVLACPLTEETEGLIGFDELRLLGEEGVLVNVARGAVCDEDALTTALQYHVIRGAALDTFETEPLPEESPLWDLSNTIVTPHMAGSTPHKPERWTEIIADNYAALADDGAFRNRVV